MASESSHLIRSPSRKAANYRPSINNAEPEIESTLGTSVYSPSQSMRGRRDTINELNDLLTALDSTRTAVQAQLDAQVMTDIGRRPRPLIPNWVTRYLLLITFLGQTLTVGLIEVIEKYDKKTGGNSTQHDVELVGDILLTVLQAAHLLLVFFVSFKVAKQVLHHTASGSLVAQAYLSTVLLFAGLYTLIYRFKANAWSKVNPDGKTLSPILLFLRMLFFSISTATLCGISTVEPEEWYTNIIVGFQMLTSFVYFTSIMSVAITPRRRSQFDRPISRVRSLTRKIRRLVFGERARAVTFTL